MPLPWLLTALGSLLAAGLIAAGTIDRACHHAGPPVTTPVPGTPRAHACDALGAGAPWPLVALVPLAIGALAFALRRSRRWVWTITALLCAASVAAAVVVASLEHAVTI